jgi:hypothetical protein
MRDSLVIPTDTLVIPTDTLVIPTDTLVIPTEVEGSVFGRRRGTYAAGALTSAAKAAGSRTARSARTLRFRLTPRAFSDAMNWE